MSGRFKSPIRGLQYKHKRTFYKISINVWYKKDNFRLLLFKIKAGKDTELDWLLNKLSVQALRIVSSFMSCLRKKKENTLKHEGNILFSLIYSFIFCCLSTNFGYLNQFWKISVIKYIFHHYYLSECLSNRWDNLI